VAVGMKGGEIYEFSLPTHSRVLLIEGHSYRECHGLATNPVVGDEYATIGDDGILRIWSYKLRMCLRRVAVEAASRAICYSPDGQNIIVGLGGDPTQSTKDGAFMVICSDNLEIMAEDRKAKLHITDIKFSPDGQIMAMTSADGKCYLHDAKTNAYLRTINLPSKSAVQATKVDFSNNGDLVRVSTSDEEMFHFNADSGDVITAPLDMRDIEWHTNSCPYTWNSQGYWLPTPLNNNIISVTLDSRKTLAAVAYQSGMVRLYRFPIQTYFAEVRFVPITGIATQAHSIRFSSDGRYLVCLDAYTRAVTQYTLRPIVPEAAPVMNKKKGNQVSSL